MNSTRLVAHLTTVSALMVSVACPALPRYRNANLIALCQYVDSGQESNINNVIHAHTRRGNTLFQSAGNDPQDARGRNSREFDNIHDQGAENTRQAAANIASNGPSNRATHFIVADNENRASTRMSRLTHSSERLDNAPGIEHWKSMRPYLDGLISCAEQSVITCAPNGLSSISLDSGSTKWSAPGDRADWPPTLAGDTVALIGNSFHTIYGYSRATGELLWKKNESSNILASDGSYFYIIRAAYWDLQALDPGSGAVVWSLRLPRDPEGGYPAFLKFHNGLLFTVDCVIDISKRAIVHKWPLRSSFVTAIGFDSDDHILVGNSSGVVSAYDRNFKPLWRAFAGKEQIVSLAPAGKNILALVYVSQHNSVKAHNVLVLLTRQAKRLWQLEWPLHIEGFGVFGDELVIVEPETSEGKFQLTSRHLATGKLEWQTNSQYLYGWPVLCRDTVYVTDGNRLHSFDLHTGKETTTIGTGPRNR